MRDPIHGTFTHGAPILSSCGKRTEVPRAEVTDRSSAAAVTLRATGVPEWAARHRFCGAASLENRRRSTGPCDIQGTGLERATKGLEMPTLFEGTYETDDIREILDRMRANCPRPSSNSGKLWKLRRRTNVSGHNPSRETLFEKAVAMLADNGHMPRWFNQCPVASGIGGPTKYKRSNIDLVHWRGADSRLSLVELKWDSNTPSEAVRQILRCGAAYLFCRTHRERLPVGKRRAMSATHVALRVAAPGRYYADDGFRDCLSRARESLRSMSGEPGTRGLSMSLDALAFPEWFDRLPFSDGVEVRNSCDRPELTEKGRIVVEAVNGLTSVYPDCEGAKE